MFLRMSKVLAVFVCVAGCASSPEYVYVERPTERTSVAENPVAVSDEINVDEVEKVTGIPLQILGDVRSKQTYPKYGQAHFALSKCPSTLFHGYSCMTGLVLPRGPDKIWVSAIHFTNIGRSGEVVVGLGGKNCEGTSGVKVFTFKVDDGESYIIKSTIKVRKVSKWETPAFAALVVSENKIVFGDNDYCILEVENVDLIKRSSWQ